MPELSFILSDTDIDRIASAVAAKITVPQQACTYTIADLMDKLQLSRDTITDRIRKGQFGEVLQDGRRYRVTEKGLQQYIDQHSGQIHNRKQQKERLRVRDNPGRI
jgi:predicted transcriptional regulator